MAKKKEPVKKSEKIEKQSKPVKAEELKKKKANPDLKKFGEKIKKLRIGLGFTNADFFAYDNNITRSQYSRYESGIDDLRLTSVLKLLRLMKVKPSEFFKDFD